MACKQRKDQGTNAIIRGRSRERERETDLDAVGRVVRGEHVRARRRRRLVEVLRPEHAHGGEADVVAGAVAAARDGARQEGQLVGVGVQRGVEEHVDGGSLCGDDREERAAGQDVARDGGSRELEPPRAAHEADGDPPWRWRRRGC